MKVDEQKVFEEALKVLHVVVDETKKFIEETNPDGFPPNHFFQDKNSSIKYVLPARNEGTWEEEDLFHQQGHQLVS